MVALIVALPWCARYAVVLALAAYVLILVQGWVRFYWLGSVPGGALIRRGWRIVVFLLPIAVVGPPRLHWNAIATALAVLAVVPPLLAERNNLRTSLNPRFLALFGPQSKTQIGCDLMYFSFAGAVQEYLYRGLVQSAFVPYLGVAAVGVSALLFVVEHLTHPKEAGMYWDLHDVLVHAYLGVVFGVICYAFGSLGAVIVAHTLYNAPNVVQVALRWRVTKGADSSVAVPGRLGAKE